MGEPRGPTHRFSSYLWYRCRSRDRHDRPKPKSDKVAIPPMANRTPKQGQIARGKKMTPQELKLMSVDELWSLHELVTATLARKITAEKSQLDRRLRQLGMTASGSVKKINHACRPYPQVFPK